MTITPQTTPDLLAPYDVCGTCGATPALDTDRHGTLCGPCHVRQLLEDGAEEHMRTLAGPLLGAWAHHWRGVGLELDALAALLESLADVHTTEELAHPRRVVTLRALAMKHAPPPHTRAAPERHTLSVAELPTFEGVYPAQPGAGIPRPYCMLRRPDGRREVFSIGAGLDLLTLEQPDGSAVLIPLGLHGYTSGRGLQEAVLIPAALRDQARILYERREDRDAPGTPPTA